MEFSQAIQKPGMFYLVDVRDMWSRGVLVPELGKLPADVLTTWGWRATLGDVAAAPARRGGARPNSVATDGQTPLTSRGGNDSGHPAALIGRWGARVRSPGGVVLGMSIEYNQDGTYESQLAANGRTVEDRGQWHVDGNQLISHSDVTGEDDVTRFAVDGQILMADIQNVGRIRFSKQQ
jgi:hypothetical protein